MVAQRDDPPAIVGIVAADAVLRRALVLLLRAAGYVPTAHSTCDGLLASAAKRNPSPRCLLIDHQVPPGLDGIACLRRLAAAGLAVPSILIVDAPQPLPDDVIASQLVAVLSKPVVDDEVVIAVAAVTGGGGTTP